MRKVLTGTFFLFLAAFLALPLSAQRFVHYGEEAENLFWGPWELGEGWSNVIEYAGDTYEIVWETHRGPLTIQMHFAGDEPLPPDSNIDIFINSLPDRAEWEKHQEDAYDDYLEHDYIVPFVTGTVDGRRFHARADFPDYYGMLTVLYVPIGLEDEYSDTIQQILYP